MKTLTFNHIDRVRKFVKSDDKENRMMIAIDYNDDTDTWERYQIYYNKNMEISEPFNCKTLTTLEQVGNEIKDIYDSFGMIDYMNYNDNKELKYFIIG